MKKIALVANSSWYIYNFRLKLVYDILDTKNKVIIIAPWDKYTKSLIDLGFEVHTWQLKRSSLNPLDELISIFNLFKILKKESPDLIHNFTIKSCLYGSIAAKFSKVSKVVNSITGIGHLFINNSMKITLLRLFLKPIYNNVFKSRNAFTIFQNIHDQEFFLNFGIINNLNNSFLIEGSGVDAEFFKNNKNHNNNVRKTLKLLFPSRLILEKGIMEVLKAHNSLINQGEKIELLIAGDLDNGNRSSLLKSDKKDLNYAKSIKLLGHRSDMRNVYSQSDIVVLPSWREGLSRSLIEAAFMEKPIITTDVPGCRDIIDHGINGLLVPLKNPKAIELAILFLIRNRRIASNFGKQIRLKAEKKFDVRIINNKTINIYKKILLS